MRSVEAQEVLKNLSQSDAGRFGLRFLPARLQIVSSYQKFKYDLIKSNNKCFHINYADASLTSATTYSYDTKPSDGTIVNLIFVQVKNMYVFG